MYLAYSALSSADDRNQPRQTIAENELQLRYQAYQNACSKYSSHIAEIQKYFPNWRPNPPES